VLRRDLRWDDDERGGRGGGGWGSPFDPRGGGGGPFGGGGFGSPFGMRGSGTLRRFTITQRDGRLVIESLD